MSWVADELFIIFFDAQDDAVAVKSNALKFAHGFINEIYVHFFEKGYDLKYDVGLSCGVGLLGLQGPKKLKKTTITGAVAGRAKRLETEAKLIRQASDDVEKPILVMDLELAQAAQAIPGMTEGVFTELVAVSKNIALTKVMMWQPTKKSALKIAA